MGTADMNKQDLVRLLLDLQSELKSSSDPDIPALRGGGARWMLAVAGQQFGPYDLPTVRQMVSERQVNVEECWAWQEGMFDWVPFNHVPAFAALLHDLAPRPRNVPPPLPPSAPTLSPSLRTSKTVQRPQRFDGSPLAEEGHGLRVDLNKAAADDLLALPGITLSNSQKLVRERERRGGFRTVEEAGHYLKLQPHVVERLKERGSTTPYGGRRPSTGRLVASS